MNIDDYLEEARKLTGRTDDFLLQVLYENNFDINSSFRSLRKVGFLIFYESSVVLMFRLPNFSAPHCLIIATVFVTHVFPPPLFQ